MATVCRYLRKAVDLFAACADDLAAAMRQAARLACAVLDGTLIPIDRVSDPNFRLITNGSLSY